MFHAWYVEDKKTSAVFKEVSEDILQGDTLIKVHSSSINFKDALALHGRPGVIRNFPLIAGIDVTGEVVESEHENWKPGDMVTLNGAGLGENLHGGLAEMARVKGADLVAVPSAFTPAQASAIGTAGFTAQLAVTALEGNGLLPDEHPVLVTGAGGGAGSIAISLLAAAGYEVTAATGRVDELGPQLRALGATEVIHRDEVAAARRPMDSTRWSAVVDGVGGEILAGAIAATAPDGAIASYGLAASSDLPTTVLPFILRGISLLGINSVQVSAGMRQLAWDRLAADLSPEHVDLITSTVSLDQAQDAAATLLEGKGTGRTVVQVG